MSQVSQAVQHCVSKGCSALHLKGCSALLSAQQRAESSRMGKDKRTALSPGLLQSGHAFFQQRVSTCGARSSSLPSRPSSRALARKTPGRRRSAQPTRRNAAGSGSRPRTICWTSTCFRAEGFCCSGKEGNAVLHDRASVLLSRD